MKIGITGTRSGMNQYQRETVTKMLQEHSEGSEFHHGDCVGVDAEAALIAKELGYKIVCHPPVKDDLRAFIEADETRKSLSYFARNRNIVCETDMLIVVPYQNEWQSNGGTWYTHDYAKKMRKPVLIVFPGEQNESK